MKVWELRVNSDPSVFNWTPLALLEDRDFVVVKISRCLPFVNMLTGSVVPIKLVDKKSPHDPEDFKKEIMVRLFFFAKLEIFSRKLSISDFD